MNVRFLRREALRREDEVAMLQLFDEHFLHVDEAVVREDLDAKSHVLLLEDEGGLAGFSTIAIDVRPLHGVPTAIVFSGDTIVAPRARGSALLPIAWIRNVLASTEPVGAERVLWLLIVSGWRTYRLLPVFFRQFVPCHYECEEEHPAFASLRAERDELARSRFGSRFDPSTGIVRLLHPQPLRPGVGVVPAERADDPHLRHFFAANPGHAAGDELVCLTELSESNMTAAGLRARGVLPATRAGGARR